MMTRIFLTLLLSFAIAHPGLTAPAQASRELPRDVLALYDSRIEPRPQLTAIRSFLAMPLQYLGYRVRYHDIASGEAPVLDGLAAAAVWLPNGYRLADSAELLTPLRAASDRDIPLLLIGELGLKDADWQNATGTWPSLARRIGFHTSGSFVSYPYRSKQLSVDTKIAGFEQPLPSPLPPYRHLQAIKDTAKSHLTVSYKIDGQELVSDLIITGARGFYLPSQLAMQETPGGNNYDNYTRFWLVNPFNLLAAVLPVGQHPVPDVTTLNGNRVFFSHMDGDGWANLTEIASLRDKDITAAEVIGKQVIKAHPEFGFTAGIITSDIEEGCYGTEKNIEVARDILSLDNVEPASHTHSHPLNWNFFAHGDVEAKEKPYLDRYPGKPDSGDKARTDHQEHRYKDTGYGRKRGVDAAAVAGQGENAEDEVDALGYHTPRNYACEPFSLETEIDHSVKLIENLTKGAKRVKLYQWSGNTSPYPEFLEATRKAGLRNLNGGDSRLDAEYNSIAWLSSIGTQVGNGWQVFSPNANEFTYTNDWSERHFGYRYVTDTFAHTDHERRLKPVNVYFHAFAGQKQASLNALKTVLETASKQPLAPVWASEYAAMADGFNSLRLVEEASNRWRIENRDGLTTLRLDVTGKEVDYAHSTGILGHRKIHNSLYIALDPAVETPVLALALPGRVAQPQLESSRWWVGNLQRGANQFSYEAEGFGDGEFVWRVPANIRRAAITRQGVKSELPVSKGLLAYRLPGDKRQRQSIHVELIP